MDILHNINKPGDIKLLLPGQLLQLAKEIRDLIIKVTSQNGGHLAPSLGVVELTIALYRVFNFPKDKLVWDVGHQAYAHKILTGRRDAFYTLRKKNGIAGFPKRAESKYDAFGTGHASTSVSAALGMAAARDIDKADYKIIAVIGDGALTGGEAFEALNNAGAMKKDMLIILNDNEMSISKNVGAMSSYLSQIRTIPEYERAKKDIGHLLQSLPKIGDAVYKTAERLKDGLKNTFIAGGLFENMGLSYIGPVNGNDLQAMTEILQRVKSMKGPVLLHVLTKKGKGYPPAEKQPDKFHGIGRFDITTGQSIGGKNTKPTYTQVFSKTLLEMARTDKDIVAITAAMPGGTGLIPFAQQYPNRFFDVGIAEEHALTMAAGLAADGKKPIAAIYSTFVQRGYDQIIHDICLQRLPVVICLDRAGIVGEDGPTHNGVFDYSFLRAVPNITIMAPKDENEMQKMLYTAIVLHAPVVIRYPRGQACGVSLDAAPAVLDKGKAELIADGGDIALIAVGSMVYPAVEAAQKLASEKIDCTVVNARFIKPLDNELFLELAKAKKYIFTIEENVLTGGFGSAVLELFSDNDVSCKVKRMGLPDVFIQQGSRGELLADNALTAEGIYNFVKKNINDK